MSWSWVRYLLDFFIFADISPVGRIPCQTLWNHDFGYGGPSGTSVRALEFVLLVVLTNSPFPSFLERHRYHKLLKLWYDLKLPSKTSQTRSRIAVIGFPVNNKQRTLSQVLNKLKTKEKDSIGYWCLDKIHHTKILARLKKPVK